MARVVDRRSVEEHEVLVRAPAADAGEKLERLQHVGLAEEGRHPADVAAGHDVHAHHRRRLRPSPRFVGLHDDLAERRVRRFQCHGERAVTVEGERIHADSVADVGDDEADPSGREGEAEEAVSVRRRPAPERRGRDGRPDERLARPRVGDRPAEGVRAGRRRGGLLRASGLGEEDEGASGRPDHRGRQEPAGRSPTSHRSASAQISAVPHPLCSHAIAALGGRGAYRARSSVRHRTPGRRPRGSPSSLAPYQTRCRSGPCGRMGATVLPRGRSDPRPRPR